MPTCLAKHSRSTFRRPSRWFIASMAWIIAGCWISVVSADDPPTKPGTPGNGDKTGQPAASSPKKRSATRRPVEPTKDNSAGFSWRSGRRPVFLWPPQSTQPANSGSMDNVLGLGDWIYRATRSAVAADGVPWELIVTPSNEAAKIWQKGTPLQPGAPSPPGLALTLSRIGPGEPRAETALPVIELPEAVWKQRMSADLQNVVGVHFHEFVSDDVARILYTVHKVPPDKSDGAPMNGSYEGKAGTRIEATLLAPVIWSLDQSIVVRVDSERTPIKEEREKQTHYRIAHEQGHAEISQEVMRAVIAGPQTWSLKYCRGRRSRVEYYWKRELVGRSWDGYQAGGGARIATLRTSIAVVPPTRWSLLLPIPPERVTVKQLQQFNDSIVLLGTAFAEMDRDSQERFHSHQGEYDAPVGP